MQSTKISIPGSTSNLGASFDTCGLALSLYLKVAVEAQAGDFVISPTGEGAEQVPRNESNLIARVARFVAEQRGNEIGGARLQVENEIPLARGLGSSSSAILAGISVYEALSGVRLSEDEIFSYALNFEEHGDNLAPGLLGGLVVTCMARRDDGEKSLIAIKRAWPEEIKAVLLIPEIEMETKKMRGVLPPTVPRGDAIFNIQRAALLQAAIAQRRFDLFNEAFRDHLHQPYRVPLAPGLADVLRLNDETRRHQGLLGVALSGAGSTMIGFAVDDFDAIAAAMQERLDGHGVRSRTLLVDVDNVGRKVVPSSEFRVPSSEEKVSSSE